MSDHDRDAAIQWIHAIFAERRPIGIDEMFVGVEVPEGEYHEAISAALHLTPSIDPMAGLRRWDQRCWQGEHETHPLAELVSRDTVDLWWEVAQHSESPRVFARFADLVWSADPGRQVAAQRAIEGYVASTEQSELDRVAATPRQISGSDDDGQRWRVAYIARRLGRAREIARTAHMPELDSIDAALINLVEDCSESDDPADALFAMYELAQPRNTAPRQLATLGLTTLERLADHPGAAHDMKRVVDMTSALLDDAAAKEAWRMVVDAFVQFAEKAEGPTRYHLLHTAHELALDKGITDRREQIQQALGAIDLTDYLVPIQAEVTFTDEERVAFEYEIDAFVDQLIDPTSALRSLSLYGRCEPVNVAELETRARKAGPQLSTSFTTHVLGPRSTIAESAEDRLWVHVVNDVIASSKFWAFWVGKLFLERFAEAFDDFDDLASEIEAPPIWSAESAQRIVEVLRLIREDRIDAACHLAAPVIEQTYREWAYLAGRLQRPQPRPGSFAEPQGLGAVLSSLEGLIPEETRRWLKILLVDSPGLNMRNNLVHGTARLPDPPETALLVHAMCLPLGLRHELIDTPPVAPAPDIG